MVSRKSGGQTPGFHGLDEADSFCCSPPPPCLHPDIYLALSSVSPSCIPSWKTRSLLTSPSTPRHAVHLEVSWSPGAHPPLGRVWSCSACGTPPPGRGRVPWPALGDCTRGWEGSRGLGSADSHLTCRCCIDSRSEWPTGAGVGRHYHRRKCTRLTEQGRQAGRPGNRGPLLLAQTGS